MEERSSFKGKLVSSTRLMSHISVHPTDSGATFIGSGLINEPLFFTSNLMNEPHFFKSLEAYSRGQVREVLGEVKSGKEAVATEYLYRLMSHISLKTDTDKRAIKVASEKTNEPHSFDGRAIFFSSLLDGWTTKVRRMSHKILCKLIKSKENSKYNSLTNCSYKNNKTGKNLFALLNKGKD